MFDLYHIVILTVGSLSIGFMLWFLHGLIADERKSRRKRSSKSWFPMHASSARPAELRYFLMPTVRDRDREYVSMSGAGKVAAQNASPTVLPLPQPKAIQAADINTTKKTHRRLRWRVHV